MAGDVVVAPRRAQLPWSSGEPAETRAWKNRALGESDKAWATFNAWLRMPPSLRTYAAASRSCGVHENSIQKWRRLYGWEDRARAYDAHREREATSMTEALLRKADADRLKVVAAGVELLKLSVMRKLLALRKGKDETLTDRQETNMLAMLNQLQLLQGRATQIAEVKLSGESLASALEKELDSLGVAAEPVVVEGRTSARMPSEPPVEIEPQMPEPPPPPGPNDVVLSREMD